MASSTGFCLAACIAPVVSERGAARGAIRTAPPTVRKSRLSGSGAIRPAGREDSNRRWSELPQHAGCDQWGIVAKQAFFPRLSSGSVCASKKEEVWHATCVLLQWVGRSGRREKGGQVSLPAGPRFHGGQLLFCSVSFLLRGKVHE